MRCCRRNIFWLFQYNFLISIQTRYTCLSCVYGTQEKQGTKWITLLQNSNRSSSLFFHFLSPILSMHHEHTRGTNEKKHCSKTLRWLFSLYFIHFLPLLMKTRWACVSCLRSWTEHQTDGRRGWIWIIDQHLLSEREGQIQDTLTAKMIKAVELEKTFSRTLRTCCLQSESQEVKVNLPSSSPTEIPITSKERSEVKTRHDE